MSTKGPSMRYGNTRGAHHRGEVSKVIGYQWAKGFNRGGLAKHFRDHGAQVGAHSEEEYASKGVHFANEVDRQNFKSVIDKKGTTYKYDPRDGKLVIVTKDGYVVSYYHVRNKFTYTNKKGKVITVWIKH